jgi:hypothetical protein
MAIMLMTNIKMGDIQQYAFHTKFWQNSLISAYQLMFMNESQSRQTDAYIWFQRKEWDSESNNVGCLKFAVSLLSLATAWLHFA